MHAAVVHPSTIRPAPRPSTHPNAAIVAELPALAAELTAGTFTVDAAAVPLSDVETIWSAPAAAGRRIVFTP